MFNIENKSNMAYSIKNCVVLILYFMFLVKINDFAKFHWFLAVFVPSPCCYCWWFLLRHHFLGLYIIFFRWNVLNCNPHLWQGSGGGQPPIWLGKRAVWVQGQYAMWLRKWWQKRYGCLNCIWITGALSQIKLHLLSIVLLIGFKTHREHLTSSA